MNKFKIIDIIEYKKYKTARSCKYIPVNLDIKNVEILENDLGPNLINLNHYYFNNYLKIHK